MVQISHIKQVGKFLGMEGKMYIPKTQATKPTILDGFKAQLSSDRMVYSNIRKINKSGHREMPKAKDAFLQELKKNGLDVFDTDIMPGETKKQYAERLKQSELFDVIFSSRVKGIESTRSKMLKQIEKMKNFDTNPELMDAKTRDTYDDSMKILNNFLTNKPTNEKYKFLVGDTLGLRISANQEQKNGKKVSNLVFKSLGNLDKKNKIKTKAIENYYGKGIEPYTTRAEIEKHFDTAIYAQTEKKYGYTRVNSDINVNGINGEFQYGGKHTSNWGDKEHVLYDKRSNKKLDTSHYTPEQTRLAKEIRNKYGQLLKDEQKDEKYALYLKEVWTEARNAEKNESHFVAPLLPNEFNQILSAENILKL